ncbi:MAG: retron St85 family RNA-directed DNA polymerase, partial [Alcanivoracaceae bacterium]|nr:retron St85 family RNA-directed DNA polymerase [Alcanivoracaceae bacterium]
MARRYWPRVTEQLSQVGLVFSASDASNFRYYSFPTLKLLQAASGTVGPERDMTLTQLALAIGVTPRLLSSFVHKKENHYRTFSIPKRGGGYRTISSPRFFLKTVQYWIKSYFIDNCRVHSSAHAYRKGFSIQTNASDHVGRQYVANIDIVDFFGSIKESNVKDVLVANGIGAQLASAISKLVTFNGCLPQGAPTSPALSNAFLFNFDSLMSVKCAGLGMSYSRYADDITISGNEKSVLMKLLEEIEKELLVLGLRLNDEKTRIASSNSSQRVTGLVVNEKIKPPKEYLKKTRAMFHNAAKYPESYFSRIDEMRGHYSYLSSFHSLQGSRHLRRYRIVLRKISVMANRLEGRSK